MDNFIRYSHWNQTGENRGVELHKTATPWTDFYILEGVGRVMVRTVNIAIKPEMEFLAFRNKDNTQQKFIRYISALHFIGVDISLQ